MLFLRFVWSRKSNFQASLYIGKIKHIFNKTSNTKVTCIIPKPITTGSKRKIILRPSSSSSVTHFFSYSFLSFSFHFFVGERVDERYKMYFSASAEYETCSILCIKFRMCRHVYLQLHADASLFMND